MFLLFIFAREFVLPVVNTSPMAPKTQKVQQLTNKNIFAVIVLEKFLILFNMIYF